MEQKVIAEIKRTARQARWRDSVVLLAAAFFLFLLWSENPETIAPCKAESAAARLDFQSATFSELKAIAGIGDKTARKIVSARTGQGVSSLEECYRLGLINRFNLERATPYFKPVPALPNEKQKVAQK